MTGQLPDDAITAEAIDAFTVACAKASSVPGASAGDCYRAGLTAALPALTGAITAQATTAERAKSEIVDAALEEIATWEWAAPIVDRYTIRSPRESGGCFLHCTACDADLFSVGEMDLWEFALDAKRHDLEKHADLLGGTADGAHAPGGAT